MPRQYEDHETRRRQVAEATLRTLAEVGVAGFTTRAVAGRVGISDGTLFRHFGSKKDIVLEAMGVLERGIHAGLVRTANPKADLESFFRHRAAFVGADGSVGRLIFSDALLHLAGDEGQAKVEEWRRASVGFLLERLESVRVAGDLRDVPDLPAMGMLVQGALLTFAMAASLNRAGTAEALSARIDHAWNALGFVLFR